MEWLLSRYSINVKTALNQMMQIELMEVTHKRKIQEIQYEVKIDI